MKMNILVVDDDQLVNDFLAEALSRTGHNIDTCLSGEDALEELADKRYDMLVSDIKMKGIDGITLLKEAKKIQPEIVSGYVQSRRLG